jgi:hypothetical protein
VHRPIASKARRPAPRAAHGELATGKIADEARPLDVDAIFAPAAA